MQRVVSFAAVIRVDKQRFSPLHDNPAKETMWCLLSCIKKFPSVPHPKVNMPCIISAVVTLHTIMPKVIDD